MLGAQGWGYSRVRGSGTGGTNVCFARAWLGPQSLRCAQISVIFPPASERQVAEEALSRQALVTHWLCGPTPLSPGLLS